MKTEEVLVVLRRVLDPEHPVNVVEMGLVKNEDVTITDETIRVEFAPTSPMCPMGAVIGIIIRKALEDEFPDKKVTVTVKSGTHMREEACNTMINDEDQYQTAIDKLTASGALDRLIVKG
ncbi:MAG: iron-sulfur cluster assembly protein [Candidatus Hermodarchaeota archaeon]|nr:iron-sulfur cluster assembly protein [Candidatus Hermodarchaeota archaeon]